MFKILVLNIFFCNQTINHILIVTNINFLAKESIQPEERWEFARVTTFLIYMAQINTLIGMLPARYWKVISFSFST